MGLQFYGCAVAIAWSCVASWVLLKLIDYFWGLRVAIEEELAGLDIVCHGENLFALQVRDLRLYVSSCVYIS